MERIWFFFLDRRRFTFLLVGVVALLGLVSIVSMPKESEPEVVVPIGVVSTVYPGASALDVERLVTDELEKEIDALDDLKQYSSTSSEGISTIVVEFVAESDIDGRIRALKDAVDDAVSSLPSEVERPFVKHISVSDDPLMVVNISVPGLPAEQKRLADLLEHRFETISGVSEARVLGVRDSEVQVTVYQSKLSQFGLSITDVVRALGQQDARVPVGSIEQEGTYYTVRFDGGIDEPSLLERLPITSVGGYPVSLRDVALVTSGFEDPSTFSRLSLSGNEAVPSLMLEIFKKDRADILNVVDAVSSELSALQLQELLGADVYVSFNKGDTIRQDIRKLLLNGLETVIIVFLLLAFFLGFREAVIAGISIPLTFLVTFIWLSALGFTLNFLVLFSLILALGILVDSAVVVTDSMHSRLAAGDSSFAAAKGTVRDFQWPIISGVLTTMAAFVPMLFATGIVGQFIRSIPVTVSIVLFSSLFVSLGVVPVFCVRFMKVGGVPLFDHSLVAELSRLSRLVLGALVSWYRGALECFLASSRRQLLLVQVLVVSFCVALALPFTGLLKTTLFPAINLDWFTVQVELPLGSTVSMTDDVMKRIEEVLVQDPLIVSFTSTVGSGGGQSIGVASRSGHLGRFFINLVPSDDRDQTVEEMLEQYRERLVEFEPATITLVSPHAGPPQGTPVEIAFDGLDVQEVERLARDGAKILSTIDGATGVETSLQEVPFEYVFQVDRFKVAQVGVTPLAVAQTLRTALFGVDAVTLKKDGDDIDVSVRMDLNASSDDPYASRRTTVQQVESLLLSTPKGMVPLGSLAQMELRSGTSPISHRNGRRTAKITAELKPGAATQDVVSVFHRRSDELSLPEGTVIRYGGEAEQVQDSFSSMYRAFIIGVFLILSILVLQFDSFVQAFIILVTLPLGVIGVFPGLTLVSQPLSFPAFIGVVALVGIVVNNAIILVDRINAYRKSGEAVLSAIRLSAESRLRPILLTTITTVAGILPLTLSDPTWGPLGFSIIFGLMFSTLLTLFVVPMLYLRFVGGGGENRDSVPQERAVVQDPHVP